MTSSQDDSHASALNAAWNSAYQRRDNFVFYPEEELVRFLSRFIRKRIGLNEFIDVAPDLPATPSILDLGCGIGRHVALCLDFGFDPCGIDLSEHAIATATDWMQTTGWDAQGKLVQGSVADLPWESDSFDHAISHAVLDSMPFEVACEGCAEVSRVLKLGGYFYFDVIAGHESGQGKDFAGELTITGAHETGTIQSYFDTAKIDEMLAGAFTVLQRARVVRTDIETGWETGRWHVVCRKD